MNAPNTCPECGKTVTPNNLGGLCPECMMKVGLAPQTGEKGPSGTQVANPLPPPSVAEIARLFPQLEILGALGCGGMGAIYKARQPRLDRLVALKILLRNRDDQLQDAHFTERFEREARALAKLSHPNIVTMYEFGQVEGLPYFIMEFVDGLNLRELERAAKLSPHEALQIVPQICAALQFAHEAGVVHRDIKPENILVDQKGRVKIADFGIAKIVGRDSRGPTLTEGQQVIGTPHYMAPEQVEKPQTVDHRADIYSLGVVFYEMLTGELPLGKFAPPSKAVHVDVRLDEVVLHALEKQPERRYQHASEVKTDVETIAASEHATVRPRSAAPATVNPWQPAILLAGGLISAAVLLAGTALERPINWIAFLFGSFGVLVALFKLAGLWPFPSGLVPSSNFTRRNLSSDRPVLVMALFSGGVLALTGALVALTGAVTRAKPPTVALTAGAGTGISLDGRSRSVLFSEKVRSVTNRVAAEASSSPSLQLIVGSPQEEIARVRLDQAQREFKRVKALYTQKLISSSEYDRARLALDIANGELRGDTNAVKIIKLELAKVEFQRASELYDQHAVGETEFQKARTSLDIAAAQSRRDAVAVAQFTHQWLEGELQRATELYQKRLMPEADYEKIQDNLHIAAAELKAAQAGAAALNGSPSRPNPTLGFGPVIERVIAHEGTNAFLDLDSGQFFPYNGPKLESGKIPEGRIDLYYRPTLSALDDLATVGMRCVFIAKGQAAWAQPPSPATLCTLLDEAAGRGGGGEAILSPSTIYAFRTREGTVGLLQSLGANEDWSGVRVRYRLVESNAAQSLQPVR